MAEARVEMTPEQSEAFLATPRHAIAAALREDGAPQLSPVRHLYEVGRLYFSVLVSTATYRQLRRDSRIARCIDGGHPDARFVAIYGTAEVVETPSAWRGDLAWRIARRHCDSDDAARSWLAEVAAPGPRALAAVTRERILGRDYNSGAAACAPEPARTGRRRRRPEPAPRPGRRAPGRARPPAPPDPAPGPRGAPPGPRSAWERVRGKRSIQARMASRRHGFVKVFQMLGGSPPGPELASAGTRWSPRGGAGLGRRGVSGAEDPRMRRLQAPGKE